MIRLTPSFKEKIWGSTRLEPFFRNSGAKIGEVWFDAPAAVPLLVKFLFTSEKLSVQVHPDDAYARQHHDSYGKTEMWHILAAEPGAQIAAGFKESLTPRQLRQAVQSGSIETLLQWHDAKHGDTFFIPAGTVHAIGGGLTICEIQQHSDITYRLHDYGRPRELHIDRAVEVSHLTPIDALQKCSNTAPEQVLVSCPAFTTSRLCIANSSHYLTWPGVPGFLVMIQGSGTLDGQSSSAGDVWYLEAGVEKIAFSGDAIFLRITPQMSIDIPMNLGIT